MTRHSITDCTTCFGTQIVVRQTPHEHSHYDGSWAKCFPCPKCGEFDRDTVMGHHPCSLLVTAGYATWLDTKLAPVVASMWNHGFYTDFGCQGGRRSRADGGDDELVDPVILSSGYLGGPWSSGWLEHLRTLIDPTRYIEIKRDSYWSRHPSQGHQILVRWENEL